MTDEIKAYFLILAIGIGYLFPLSALTQPIDYWHVLFPTINIEFPLTTTFMWVNLAVLGAIVFFRQNSSVSFRIVVGFLGQLVVLAFVPSLPSFSGNNENTLFWLVMIATAIAASATALIDSVAIGFAAQFPPKVLEGLQLGIGLSTLIGSVYRIFTKAMFSSEETIQSSILYFYVGAFTIFLCIVAYYYLLCLPLTIEIRSRKYESTAEENLKLLNELMIQNNATSPRDKNYSAISPTSMEDGSLTDDNESGTISSNKHYNPYNNAYNNDTNDAESSKNELSVTPTASSSWTNNIRILKKVAFKQFLVFFVFFISLFLWPGMVTEIPTYNFPYLEETRWWSLLLLLDFSVFDCIGRLLTSHRMGLTSNNIWIIVFGRILLVPIFFFMAYYGKASSYTIWHSDLWSVGLTSFMGFTNGYIGSLCIIMVTEDVLPEEKHTAGAFTGFFLNLGLVFGSTAALIFHQ
jgi:hypothetical protein